MYTCIQGQLIVFFDCPFWVGVFEVNTGGTLRICRIVFGPNEPKDCEIYQLILEKFFTLKFTTSTASESAVRLKPINPKRQQRQINKQIKAQGISTKSFLAIKAGYEAHKLEKKRENKQVRDALADKKFQQKQQKKRQKCKGH